MLTLICRFGLRLVVIVWLLGLVLVGARFAMQNTQSIRIDLVFWVLPEASVGFTLVVTLFLGVLLGVCTILPALVVFKAKIGMLRAKLAKTEKRLVGLEQSTLLDPNIP